VICYYKKQGAATRPNFFIITEFLASSDDNSFENTIYIYFYYSDIFLYGHILHDIQVGVCSLTVLHRYSELDFKIALKVNWLLLNRGMEFVSS
jgi:hypothetical protein